MLWGRLRMMMLTYGGHIGHASSVIYINIGDSLCPQTTDSTTQMTNHCRYSSQPALSILFYLLSVLVRSENNGWRHERQERQVSNETDDDLWWELEAVWHGLMLGRSSDPWDDLTPTLAPLTSPPRDTDQPQALHHSHPLNDLTLGWQNVNPVSHPDGNTSASNKAGKGYWWKFELCDTITTSKA